MSGSTRSVMNTLSRKTPAMTAIPTCEQCSRQDTAIGNDIRQQIARYFQVPEHRDEDWD